MVLTVVSGLLHILKLLIKLWSEWQLRGAVLLSLLLQTVLILLGNRRKYKANIGLQFFSWFAYISADWVAIYALGILSKNSYCKDKSSDPNIIITASWASFLLVHLGGPDTITAYSLEDNELWKRRWLELIGQVYLVIYVLSVWWNGTIFIFAIPVLIAGLIKCTERNWALMSGSSDNFRKSILPSPDPGPNYAKFTDEYSSRKDEGYNVSVGTVIDTAPAVLGHAEGAIRNDTIPDATNLDNGFRSFQVFKCLFADLIISFHDRGSSRLLFHGITWEAAFRIIEIELGLMYDRLYTKAVLTYSRFGIFLKTVSFSCTLLAFIIFCHLINRDEEYKTVDEIISFCLFLGAIVLEIYAFIVLLCSDRAMLWLMTKHKNRGVDLLYKFISFFQKWFRLSNTKRWSNRMSQFNLVSFSLRDEPVKCIGMQTCLHIYQFLENYYYHHVAVVTDELKSLIFEQLKEKSMLASNIKECKRLCAHRGDQVLVSWNCHAINWSVVGVDFDESILLWHIATDLCYYSDVNSSNSNCIKNSSCRTAQLLSNYMLYLLVMRPSMLPNGIGQIRVQDTRAEAIEFFQEREDLSDRKQACLMLLRVNTDIEPSRVKGDRSKSVLFDACRLAKSLQSLESDEVNWPTERKWKMMSQVWVEMLSYAASHCRGLQHAKQLMQGGELLTHVWLLMAHLGITEQFQISQGHARAKLEVT